MPEGSLILQLPPALVTEFGISEAMARQIVRRMLKAVEADIWAMAEVFSSADPEIGLAARVFSARCSFADTRLGSMGTGEEEP